MKNFFLAVALISSVSTFAMANTAEDDFAANKIEITKLVKSCEYDEAKTLIINNAEACQSNQKKICEMAAICTDYGGYKGMKLTGRCYAPNGLCPTDPIDCTAAANFRTGPQGSAAIGDQNFPKKASLRSTAK